MTTVIPDPGAIFTAMWDGVILAFASASRTGQFELALSVITFVVVHPAIFGFNARRS